jgi:hypothetical protein
MMRVKLRQSLTFHPLGLLERNRNWRSQINLDSGMYQVWLFFFLSSIISLSIQRCLLPTVNQETGIKDPYQEPTKTLKT